MSVPLIDLGDLSDPAATPDEYPPARPREFDRARLTRLVPAVFAVVCVLMLGGSARPGPAVLREMWSAPFSDNDTLSVHGNFVYVGRPVTGGSELTAYDIATGATRWTHASTQDPTWIDAVKQTGVLLLPGDEQMTDVTLDDGNVITYSYGGTVTALDPATGRSLWKQPGMLVYGNTGDKLLLHDRGRDGMLTGLRLVNSRDGSLVWEQRLPAGVDGVEIQSENGVASRIVTARPSGELTMLRYSDGTPVTSARVPWSPMSSSTGRGSMLATATGLVMVIEIAETKSTMTAYRADTLRRLWSREFTDWAHVQDCGPVVCVGSGGLFTAVDPLTGTTRWTGDGNPAFGALLQKDRLLVTGNDDAPKQTVVDATTGRPIGATGRGQVVYRDDTTGAMILLRDIFPDLTRTAVSRLDPVTGRVVTLGTLPVRNDRLCTGEGRYLACQSETRLTITAVG